MALILMGQGRCLKHVFGISGIKALQIHHYGGRCIALLSLSYITMAKQQAPMLLTGQTGTSARSRAQPACQTIHQTSIKRLTLLLAALTLATTAWAQVTITGTVVSREDHSPLPGVNVFVKGTQNGTNTQIDGTFSLTVAEPNPLLVFSFIGMVTQEVPLNGQIKVFVRMKADCIRDYFDVQRIGIYACSGLINTPVGGQLDLAFPPYFGKGTLVGGIGYQTDFDRNRFLNAKAELKHFVWTCNFDMDVNWYYRKVDFEDEIKSRAYSVETNFGLRRLILIAGYSNLRLSNPETINQRTLHGPVVGMGSWIGGPLRLTLIAKAAIYHGHLEYIGQIKRESRSVNLFLNFYKLESFTELSLGAGKEFGYRLKRKP
jgi:hypothetical protein